jgi:hypothetical protein
VANTVRKFFLLLGILFSCAFGSTVFAANESAQTFTLDGQLFQTGSSNPLLDASVKLTVQIIDPGGNCLLYEEQQFADTRNTDGYFSVHVGSATGAVKRTVSDPGRSMTQIFQNITGIAANSVPGQTCAGGVYSPAVGAVRYFRIIVTPSATNVADTLTPDIVMDSVGSAIVAQSVQGLERASILQVANSASTALTQANLEAAFTTPAYTNLQAILAGSFMRTDTSGATLPSYAATPGGVSTGDIWYDSTTNQVKYQSNGGVQTVGTSAGGISSLTVSSDLSINGTTAGTVSSGSATIEIATISSPGKVSGSAITSGTISGTTGINSSGNLVTTGTVSGLSVQAVNLRLYNGANYLQLAASASLASDISLTFPATAGTTGQVLTTNGSGILSWTSALSAAGTISVGQGGTGATSFTANRLIASNGTGSVLQSVGCSLNQVVSFDGSGNYACQNISAIFSGIQNGGNSFASDISIGTNDNQAFKFKVNNTVAMTISQDGNIGIGTASPGTALDVSGTLRIGNGTYSASIWAPSTDGFLAGNTVAGGFGSVIVGKNSNAAGGSGVVWFGLNNTFNGGGWDSSIALGQGLSVTSNSVAVGAGITNSTSGSLQIGPSNTAKMTILSSGNVGIGTVAATSALTVSGAYTAYGMSAAPTVSASNEGRIYFDYAAGKFKVSQNGGAYADLVAAGGPGDILNGGNTTGTNITIGTNDSYALNFETGGSTAVTISQNGKVGIGTTSPVATAVLTVNGPVNFSNGTVILGDTSGNARGVAAIDIQTARTAATQVATAISSTAIGQNNTAAGAYPSLAIGYSNTADSSFWGGATAVGYANTALGSGAVAVGNQNNTGGADAGIAIGFANTVGNHYGMSIGYSNSSYTNGVAMGYDNSASTSGVAVGISTETTASGAVAIGTNIVNSVANSLQIGVSNTAKMALDSSGNVGIGAGTTNANAKLHVTGAIVATPGSVAVQCVNFVSGNIQVSSYSGTNTVKIGGLVDGGAYTLVLTGYTAGQTVTIQGFTDTGCTAGVTYGVDFGGSAGAVTPTFTAVGNTQLVTFIYSASRGVVYASAGTNFYR